MGDKRFIAGRHTISSMIQSKALIDPDHLNCIEGVLYEHAPTNWTLTYNHITENNYLEGFFKNELEAKNSFEHVLGSSKFSDLIKLTYLKINEEDWKNSYKKHFNSWNIENFHWVPIWKKPSYSKPKDDLMLLLDPGMAFGTGNHETTKLCLMALVKFQNKSSCIPKTNFIDIGCGSGIIALTACLLGYEDVTGIDNDLDAIKVSHENATLNNINHASFEHKCIEAINDKIKYDFVVANIQSDILQKNAQCLIKIMRKGATLLLSGILKGEAKEVKSCFENIFQKNNIEITSSSHSMNQWEMIEFNSVP